MGVSKGEYMDVVGAANDAASVVSDEIAATTGFHLPPFQYAIVLRDELPEMPAEVIEGILLETHKMLLTGPILFLSDDFDNFTTDNVSGLEKYAIQRGKETMGDVLENKVVPRFKITPFQKPYLENWYSEIEFMMAAFGVDLQDVIVGASSKKKSAARKAQPEAEKVANKRGFKFSELGIPVGSTLTFVRDRSVTATVVADGVIRVGGEDTSLSTSAQKLLGYKNPVRGTVHWMYEGKTLKDLIDERDGKAPAKKRTRKARETAKPEDDTEPAKDMAQTSIDFDPGDIMTNVSMKRHGITVRGRYHGTGKEGKLTLLQGSVVEIGRPVHAKDKATGLLRERLLSEGALVPQQDGTATLVEDLELPSPTAAAQFVYGGAINGCVNWKGANGKSIKELYG